MKAIQILASSLVLSLVASSAMAACNPALPASLPDARFAVEGDALVSDMETGLTWTRCSLGQEWNDARKRCEGLPAGMAWVQALQTADVYENGGFSDWRLPNRKELATLVEFACHAPATNIAVFPGTLLSRYWTSTPFPGSDPLAAWFVDFNDGSYGNDKVSDLYQVRLVRGNEE